MALVEINFRPTDRELRQFAAIWFPAFGLLVAFVLSWRYQLYVPAAVVVGLCVAVAAIGIVRPAIVRPLYVAWMAASFPIGWCMAHLFFGIIFFLVITPLGLAMRALGRDPLARRFDKTRSSYWIDRDERDDDPQRYFRPF